MSGVFQQNYLSNFGNRMFLNDIARFLAMAQRGKNPHPPASQEALNKLKRFPLIERFCQKTFILLSNDYNL